MRLLARISLAALIAAPSIGVAETSDEPNTTASGSVGGGAIGSDATAIAGAELDAYFSRDLALGLAVRLRLVDGSILSTDWDERSDVGRVLRYFVWRQQLSDEISFSLAAGHLGGVRLGHGSLVSPLRQRFGF